MLTPGPDGQLAMGIRRFVLDGEEVWVHQGFFGAFQLYAPARRLSLTGTINQAASDSLPLLVAAYRIAADHRQPAQSCRDRTG
ncbi:hypothetical protein [Embleya sp. NPDC005971]|uniref:hypothetical protein n=1 Tax=Embleya sp. NPDC005971 TaxID=3156724 RepID=UPI003406C675